MLLFQHLLLVLPNTIHLMFCFPTPFVSTSLTHLRNIQSATFLSLLLRFWFHSIESVRFWCLIRIHNDRDHSGEPAPHLKYSSCVSLRSALLLAVSFPLFLYFISIPTVWEFLGSHYYLSLLTTLLIMVKMQDDWQLVSEFESNVLFFVASATVTRDVLKIGIRWCCCSYE